MKNEDILNALQWRYAAKVFDSSKKVSEEDLHTILEAGRLAPSSVGLEPWKFIVVKNETLRKTLREAAYDQPKVTDAAYIIVIAHRTDAQNLTPELIQRTAKTQAKAESDLEGLKGMADGSIKGRSQSEDTLQSWLAAQSYIPLGIMIQTAALLGIDSGPMEGFHPGQVDDILGLKSQHLHATTMLALGHRGDDHHATLPKTRRSFEEVVEMME